MPQRYCGVLILASIRLGQDLICGCEDRRVSGGWLGCSEESIEEMEWERRLLVTQERTQTRW